MGIENEMKELREEMAALRAVLEASLRDAAFYRDGGCDPEETETEHTTSEAMPAPDEPAAEHVTREVVSQICMDLIRQKRVSKAELLDIIGEFDGAKSVRAVAEERLSELYARLKELK